MEEARNFVFLGGTGSGKSEISINFAMRLAEGGSKPVHFFDMDMTKPLFRSRDVCEKMRAAGICVHYEEQFMDAPTQVGGLRHLLRTPDAYVVVDVGGDEAGARAIGGYAAELVKEGTKVFYTVNPYRPWAQTKQHIEQMREIISYASRLYDMPFQMIGNPNLGEATSTDDVIEGYHILTRFLGEAEIAFLSVRKALYADVSDKLLVQVMPMSLYLSYPW